MGWSGVVLGAVKHRFLFWLRLACLLCAGGFAARPAVPAESAAVPGGELVIRVSGAESGRGMIRYALYNSRARFPTKEGRIAKGRVPASAAGTTITIPDLKPGYYAVAVYHDENANNVFDQGLFGIPLEMYGFSNDARGFFSAPDFEEAKFLVSGGKTEISIRLEK